MSSDLQTIRSRCDEGSFADSFGGDELILVQQAVTFAEAQELCRTEFNGDLTSFTEEEIGNAFTLFLDSVISQSSAAQVWVGISDENGEGNIDSGFTRFTFVDGTDSSVVNTSKGSPWLRGHPFDRDEDLGFDCVKSMKPANAGADTLFGIVEETCDVQLEFICRTRCEEPTPIPLPESEGSNLVVFVSLGITAVLVVLVLGIVGYLYKKNKKRRSLELFKTQSRGRVNTAQFTDNFIQKRGTLPEFVQFNLKENEIASTASSFPEEDDTFSVAVSSPPQDVQSEANRSVPPPINHNPTF